VPAFQNALKRGSRGRPSAERELDLDTCG
jgi:hypothetical protein